MAKKLKHGQGAKIVGLSTSDLSEQKSMVPAHKKNIKSRRGVSKYDDTYPEIAYKVLSSGPLKTKCHLCVALECARETIDFWMGKHPDFKEAIRAGREKSQELFRDKVESFAFRPTAEVNNGLIKLMAANVYGIKEELAAPVVVNNNIDRPIEEIMLEKGIPLPIIDSPDLDQNIKSKKSKKTETKNPESNPITDSKTKIMQAKIARLEREKDELEKMVKDDQNKKEIAKEWDTSSINIFGD